ncbi:MULTISPECIES: hypothetical protein [Sediminimonas]|uniref:hypothetical protein n=1 Tax=Sediminimonas TaxID=659427 RepID=UPI0003FA897E|nr:MULTISPECIES: hypothetical protein [Sediminimonas]MDR9485292.1 hypothetical protein [Sediminimonas sp.]
MIVSLTGALMRAIAVAVLVVLPTVLLPAKAGGADQIIVLVALLASLLTFLEYNTTYPSMIEFRYAPPYNRLRFAALALTVIALTLILRQPATPSIGGALLRELASLLGRFMDFPYSPVRLVLHLLPDGTAARHVALMRDMAALSYTASILMAVVFIWVLRALGWPARSGAFNVWINLPMLSQTTNSDIVPRMQLHALLNMLLGMFLPFFVPGVAMTMSALTGAITPLGPQTMIWALTLWAFLPAGLVMRGIAINRIAVMILRKRHRGSTAASAVTAA